MIDLLRLLNPLFCLGYVVLAGYLDFSFFCHFSTYRKENP